MSSGMDSESKRALADFKSQLAKVVVNILGKYNKVDCKVGRIMDNTDFKYLARKVCVCQCVSPCFCVCQCVSRSFCGWVGAERGWKQYARICYC